MTLLDVRERFDVISRFSSAFLVGMYQWLDPSVASFNSKSSLWCQRTTPNLGYSNPYDEPTRQTYNNEFEACVVYLRGTATTGPICLDDRFCSQPLPFICEKCTL